MSQSNRGYVPPHARRGSSRLRSQTQNRSAKGIVNTQEDLERRRQRFGPSAEKPDTGYGLISRGEDNRLQRDPEARRAFFDKIRKEFAESFSACGLATLSNSMKSMCLKEGDNVSQDASKATSEEQKLSNVMMSLSEYSKSL
jgi:mannose-1-phosphate guanylyltransferase